MTSYAIENDNVELAILKNPKYLKNPNFDTEISIALLEVTLAQDSSYSFRLKLQTPNMGGSSPSVKESMFWSYIYRNNTFSSFRLALKPF